MIKQRRSWLRVEQLESRLVPASVHFVAGTLSIGLSPGEPALNLLVMQTAANTFQVTDNGGASNVGTFRSISNLQITGGNAADTIHVDLNGLPYSGSILINSGNSPTGGGALSDDVEIGNFSTPASIGGNVTVLTGTGTPFVNVGATGQLSIGGSVQLTNLSGEGDALVGNPTGTTRIGKDLTITGFSDVNPGAGKPDIIGGNVSILNPNGRIDTEILIGTNVTIGKNLTISEGAGTDSITVGQSTINGNTTIATGSGADSVSLGLMISGEAGFNALFNGNVTVNTGNGNDLVETGPNVTFSGNLNVSVGSGTDTILLTPTGGGSVTIFGNVSLSAGNGSDSILMDAPVFGNLSFRLGNGNDSVTVTNAPADLLTWSSGNGADSLTLVPAISGQTWKVNITFGSNDDTFTLAAPGGSLTGTVDGGGSNTANVFNQDATWTLLPSLVLINFP